MRKNIGSNSPFEKTIGFSRAVRIDDQIAVSGTAPISENGETFGIGDVYLQTKRCLDISIQAIEKAGGSKKDVIRTRIMLINIEKWQEAAKAHGELFQEHNPACTFVGVAAFINSEWLVETEVDCKIQKT